MASLIGLGRRAPPFEHSGADQAIGIGILTFVAVFLWGMVGASIASLIARAAVRENSSSSRYSLQTWHLGAIIAIVDILGVVAAAMLNV